MTWIRARGAGAFLVVVATATALSGQPHLASPRIAPLEEARWDANQRRLAQKFSRDGRPENDLKTLLNFPAVVEGVMPFATYVAHESTLAPRERELLILRTAWLCRSEYEWAQHLRPGRAAGLDSEQIAAGPDAPGWDQKDGTVLRAADELYREAAISDATWKALATQFDARSLVDVVITTGGYRMVSMALNTLGVQLEPGNERFPAR